MSFARPAVLPIILLLTACGGMSSFSLPPTDAGGPADPADRPDEQDTLPDGDGSSDDQGGDPADVTPEIQSIDPSWGTDAGGTIAVIEGTGFSAATEVLIDGRTATIRDVRPTSLEIDIPASPGSGRVDVEVKNGWLSDSLPGGWNYWADGLGLIGGKVALERIRYVGGYWQDSPSPLAWATAEFFEPVDLVYWQLYTDNFNGCAHNYTWPVSLVNYRLGASELRLSAGGDSIALRPSADDPDVYESVAVDPTLVPLTRTYGLDTITATDFPSFGLPDLVGATGTFDITNPNLARATMPTVGRSFDVDWEGSGGDYVVMILLHISVPPSGSASVAQAVSCATTDDGHFTIPRDIWDGWYQHADDYLDIRVARVRESRADLPHDRSSLLSVSTAWVVGAAWMN